MSEAKNECEIVNRLSRKVEKELSENMTSINEDITEINEKLEEMAVIDDTEASTTTTYSSEKIEDLISDIPTGAEIDDSTASTTTTYSSEKIEDLISDIPTGAEIDDTTETTTTTWSSSKIKTEIDAGGGGGSDVIDDVNVTTTTTFSSSKIVDLLFSVLSGESKYITINTTISRVTAEYTTVLTITDLNLSATSKGILNLNFSVTAGSSHPGKELLITGIKSDSTTYTINDTLIPRSETSTQAYTLNLPNVEFENNTTQVKIEIKNSTNDQYSATFNFTGYLNTLAI